MPRQNVQSGIAFAANNGLDINYQDNGVGSITQQPSDLAKFKVPVLRNIALTAPYMHDGRFATLEDVIDFYSTGIAPNPQLSVQLRNSNGSPSSA
ncbi:MAG: hypothetical protein R2795_09620 [Saprospiraceae bacterium]